MRLDPQLRQEASGSKIAGELETRFQPVQRVRIAERCPGRIPRWFASDTASAQRRRRLQRQGTTGAATVVARQFRATTCAQIEFALAARAAQQAARGQKRAQTAVNQPVRFQVDSHPGSFDTAQLGMAGQDSPYTFAERER